MGEIHQPFNIMCKPDCGVCNLDCRYCYYTMKPGELYPGVKKFMMTDEVLEAYTRQYLEAMPVRCEFGWQGGEPTMAGLDFYRKAIRLQKQYGRDGQVVANALQSNGTLLDDEWCEFLRENNFLVGISLDGPPQWHDRFRRDRAGNPTFHRAWAGVELLRKHKVEFNVLVTLNSMNAPHAGDIYRYFVNRGVQYLQFIPILERTSDGEPTPFSCSAENFGRFLMDIFELWTSRDVGQISERLIDSVLHTLVYGRASTCCYSQRCANAYIVEFNGDFYACDHFVFKQWRVGNITERPLAELVTDPMLDQFAKLKTHLPAVCKDCEYLELCWSGCPKHHKPIGTDPNRVNHFCEGYKLFFREALPTLREMAEYIKHGQSPPPRGAPAYQGDSQGGAGKMEPGAKAPGRNEPCPCGSGRKYKNCCGRG